MVEIHSGCQVLGRSEKKLQQFEDGVRQSFARMKGELTEHLDAINENTSEIQNNHEYIMQLEAKIDKLNEKFERILLLLDDETHKTEITIDPLTLREQEIFLALYTCDDEQYLTYRDLSHKTGLPVDMVKQLSQSIISKGVPIVKRYIQQDIALQIDKEFKDLQTKTNILELNEQLVKQMAY